MNKTLPKICFWLCSVLCLMVYLFNKSSIYYVFPFIRFYRFSLAFVIVDVWVSRVDSILVRIARFDTLVSADRRATRSKTSFKKSSRISRDYCLAREFDTLRIAISRASISFVSTDARRGVKLRSNYLVFLAIVVSREKLYVCCVAKCRMYIVQWHII